MMANELYEELADELSKDLAWRKRELIEWKLRVSKDVQDRSDPFLRFGVVVLYAHFDGFIKYTFIKYCEFICIVSKEFSLLPVEVKFAYFWGQLKSKDSFKKMLEAHLSFAGVEEMDKNHIAQKRLGDSLFQESVTYGMIEKWCTIFRIDFNSFQLDKNIIDTKFIHSRNSIAHGRGGGPSFVEYETIYNSVLVFFDNLVDALLDSARKISGAQSDAN